MNNGEFHRFDGRIHEHGTIFGDSLSTLINRFHCFHLVIMQMLEKKDEMCVLVPCGQQMDKGHTSYKMSMQRNEMKIITAVHRYIKRLMDDTMDSWWSM